MRREGLLRHLRRHGCVLRREGKEHTLWENPQTGHAEAVPHRRRICTARGGGHCQRRDNSQNDVLIGALDQLQWSDQNAPEPGDNDLSSKPHPWAPLLQVSTG